MTKAGVHYKDKESLKLLKKFLKSLKLYKILSPIFLEYATKASECGMDDRARNVVCIQYFIVIFTLLFNNFFNCKAKSLYKVVCTLTRILM